MKSLSSALAALVLLCPLGAMAQGLETKGTVALEYLRGNDASATLLSGDVMLRWSNGSFGAELGTDGSWALDGGGEFKSIYAAGILSTGFGDFAIGAPQSAADMLIDVPAFNQMKGLELGGILPGQPVSLGTPSIVGEIAKAEDRQSYGLRFTGAAGDVRYGASAHRFNGSDDTILQLAAEFTTGQTQIEGMVENQSLEGGFSGLIGVAHDQGPFSLSAYLSRQTITADGTTFQLNGDYHLNDSLTIGGSFARKHYVNEDYLYGVNAVLGFGQGGFLSGGVADGDNTGVLVDAAIGYKF